MSKGSDDLNFGQKVVGGLIGAISNTHAGSYSHHTTDSRTDRATEELLSSVRELRADLQRLVQSPEMAALDEVLASVEDQIMRTGQASPVQRERLRAALSDAHAVTSLLASAGAVAQALRP
ncbi:hypothetical protein [Streptomyces sp. NPDC059743]|uniref:hypothetical protein n=1 Tax=Streptomyces sp. NPDC059743 TaxID=3346928 RepID=UPI003669B9C2